MKETLKKLFSDYIIRFRYKTETAIVDIGYINAPENYLQYSDEKLARAEQICCDNDLKYNVEHRTECGYRFCCVRIYLKFEKK